MSDSGRLFLELTLPAMFSSVRAERGPRKQFGAFNAIEPEGVTHPRRRLQPVK